MHWIRNGVRIVVSVGFLACCTANAWAGHQPDHEGERLTPEQVGGEKRMGALLAEARALAQRGAYDAAVRNYVHVFNFGRGIARLDIVRLALIPEELAALGKLFPPALNTLREEVRVRAGLILTNVAGTDEMLELLSLNRALDQPRRSLELYDQLKSMGERSRDTRLLMRAVLSTELLEARRFDELGNSLNAMTKQIIQRIAVLEVDTEFGADQNAFFDEQRATLLENVPLTYEALLATQRDDVAGKLSNRVLRFDHTVATYAALIGAARRVSRNEIAQQLLQRASKDLQPDEVASLTKKSPR